MIKHIDLRIAADASISIDIPDHLLEILENSDTLRGWVFKNHPWYKEGVTELEQELFDLINDKITIGDLNWDEIEIFDSLNEDEV